MINISEKEANILLKLVEKLSDHELEALGISSEDILILRGKTIYNLSDKLKDETTGDSFNYFRKHDLRKKIKHNFSILLLF